MKIDMKKEYQTRDGQDARILAVDGKLDNYPVIAEVCDGDVHAYTKEGRHSRFREISGLDLIEKPEPIVRYCNVYGLPSETLAPFGEWRDTQTPGEGARGHVKVTITGKDVKTEFIPR